MTAMSDTIEDRVDRLLSQWERNSPPVPPDARAILVTLLRHVVLDAAKACEMRGQPEEKPMHLRAEAVKCAAAVRHYLLCRDNEYVCIHCDGRRCEKCNQRGVVGYKR